MVLAVAGQVSAEPPQDTDVRFDTVCAAHIQASNDAAVTLKTKSARVAAFAAERRRAFGGYIRHYYKTRKPGTGRRLSPNELRALPAWPRYLRVNGLDSLGARQREQAARNALMFLKAVERNEDLCRARTTKARSARLKIAATRPLSEINSIPAEHRIPEEAARVAVRLAQLRRAKQDELARIAAAKAVAYKRMIAGRMRSSKWIRPARSGLICAYLKIRKLAFKAIRKEKRYSRIGGVIDKVKVYGFQMAIRNTDDEIRAQRKALRRAKFSAMSCRRKRVKALTRCFLDQIVENPVADACKKPATSERVDLVRVIELTRLMQ